MARTTKSRVKKELKDKKLSDKSVDIKKSEPKNKIKSERKSAPKSVTKSKSEKVSKTKPFYGSVMLSILSSTPSEVSVPVSNSKGRRRKSNTDSKLFTQKEKKLFYECLKQNGISCLNDESILSQIFANRSIAEINAMIDGFSRKAQELNRKNEESFSNIESDPNPCKQPLEKWSDLIHQMVPNPSKKDDMSAILIDCFDRYISPEFAQQSDADTDTQTLKPDYRAIYECITGAMNGKYAKQMDPINAFVIIKLIEELKQLIKSGLNKDEMTFLESGIWWQIPNETNATKTGDDLFSAIYSQRQQQNGIQLSEDISNESESQSDNHSNDDIRDQTNGDNEETIYEIVKTFPKLRKIIECLNPLRVPIELTYKEYNRW